MSDFLEALGLNVGQPHKEPRLKFETDGGGNVLFVGYTPDEIREILAAYREHVALMIAHAQSVQTSQDAVHYTPVPGFEGFAGGAGS